MSVLDFLKESDDEFMTGYYYDFKPDPRHTYAQQLQEGRWEFKYSKVSGQERRFNTVQSHVRADSERYTIQTCDNVGFKIGGYVSTQNGKLWKIEDFVKDEQTDGNEEVLLLFKESVKTEYVLRLIKVENPWGIGT